MDDSIDISEKNSGNKRRSFTAKQKLEIIRCAEEYGNRRAGREYDVNESCVREWRKLKQFIMQMPEDKRSQRGRKLGFKKNNNLCDASMICEISLECDDEHNQSIDSAEESNERLKNVIIMSNQLIELLERYRNVLKCHKCFNHTDFNAYDKELESMECDYKRIIQNDFIKQIKRENEINNTNEKRRKIKSKTIQTDNIKIKNIKTEKRIELNDMSLDDHSKKRQKFYENDDIYIETIDGEMFDFTKYKRLKGEKNFICDWPECDYQNPRIDSFKGHIYTHYGLAPYKCDYPNCTFAYTTSKSLSTHKMLLHSSDTNPIVCTLINCGRKFKHIMSFRAHMAKHNEPYTHCKFPGCEYKTKYPKSIRFKHHVASHSGEGIIKQHKCLWPGCDRSFHFISELNEHSQSHSNERKYHCSWPGCDRMFKSKRGMELHQTSHTGEKNFVCHWPGCDYRTNLVAALNNHKVIHTGVKKFVCTWPGCMSRFALHHGLKSHMMIHKGEKPHKCEWPGCERRFVEIGNMRKHMFNIHRCRYYNANKRQ